MRPREQAESPVRPPEAAGGRALRFPVIAVGPALDPAPLQAIVGRLDEFDLAFFVSPNAVDHAMRDPAAAHLARPPACRHRGQGAASA